MRSQLHLHLYFQAIWDYMKRRAKDNLGSGCSDRLTKLDRIVLDTIGSNTVTKNAEQNTLGQQGTSTSDSGTDLPNIKTEVDASKPFQCIKCCKSFNLKKSLIKHHQLHHYDQDEDQDDEENEDFNESMSYGDPDIESDPNYPDGLANSFNFSMSVDDENNSDTEDGDTKNIFDLCNQLERKLSKFPLAVKTAARSKHKQTKPVQEANETRGQERLMLSEGIAGTSTEANHDDLSEDGSGLQEENGTGLLSPCFMNRGRTNLNFPSELNPPSDIAQNIKKEAFSSLLMAESMDLQAENDTDLNAETQQSLPGPSLPEGHHPLNLLLEAKLKLNLFKIALINLAKNTNSFVPVEPQTDGPETSEGYLKLTNEIDELLSKNIMTNPPVKKVSDVKVNKNPDSAVTATQIKIVPRGLLKVGPSKFKLKQVPHKIAHGRYYCLSGGCKTEGKSFRMPHGLREHFQRQHVPQG